MVRNCLHMVRIYLHMYEMAISLVQNGISMVRNGNLGTQWQWYEMVMVRNDCNWKLKEFI